MATTLINKVRAITKSTVALGITDDNVIDNIKSGCRFVLATAPKRMLEPLASAVTINNDNGYTYQSDTVVEVDRAGYPAKFMPHEASYAEVSGGLTSLFKATSLFPSFYIATGKLYIKPAPTVSAVGTISCAKVPEIMTNSLEVFGILEEPVLHYARGLDYYALASIFRDKVIVELETITNAGYLADFEGALPTYVPIPSPTLPSAPSGVTLPASPVSPELPDSISLSSIPTAPASPVFPSGISLPAVPSDVVLPSQPSVTLDAPVFDYDAPLSGVDYTNIDSNIASDDVEIAQTIAAKLNVQINEFQANIQNKNSLMGKQAEEYKSGLGQYGAEWQAYQSKSTSVLNEFQQKVSIYSTEVQSLLQEYNADIQKASTDIQSALNKYSTEVQAFSAEINADVEVYNAETRGRVSLFSAQVQSYSATVGALVNEYSADVQKFTAESSQILQKYSSDVQAENSEFQANLAKAKAFLDEASIRLQTMGQYNQLSVQNVDSGTRSFVLAYQLMEQHVNKFIGVQNAAT